MAYIINISVNHQEYGNGRCGDKEIGCQMFVQFYKFEAFKIKDEIHNKKTQKMEKIEVGLARIRINTRKTAGVKNIDNYGAINYPAHNGLLCKCKKTDETYE